MSENYKFNQHKTCEYFPCHEVADDSTFDCLFCYCPLYLLGEDCGGNFKYSDNGFKDCSACVVTHGPNSFDHVMSKMGLIMEKTKK